jgi:hypothetical protein
MMNSWALAACAAAAMALSSALGQPVGDVFGDGGAEEEGILQHDADMPAQAVERHRAHVDAVDADRTRSRVVEAGQQADNR